MKVFLLHRDRDVDIKPELRDALFEAFVTADLRAIDDLTRRLARARRSGSRGLPGHDDALARDLELEVLWNAMAAGDEFVFEVVKRVFLSSLRDRDAIVYRQRVLADCLKEPEIVRRAYRLAVEALEGGRQVGGLWDGASPEVVLHRSVEALKVHVTALRQLRQIAEEQAESFRSEGFTRFFAMLREELADDYLDTVEAHLRELSFRRGLLESAGLTRGNKGGCYVVHEPPREPSWKERLSLVRHRKPQRYSFELDPQDEAFGGLADIRERGINSVANAVAQAADHVRSFLSVLRLELGFYLGCVNVQEGLKKKGEPTCFPEPCAEGEHSLAAQGIYDVCLTLQLQDRVVGNEVNADGKSLVMITGTNQGGKSTLLRGLGVAHLMMQSGMFVGAQSFRASVFASIFTHYKREEDITMEGGKLDEELMRMSEIADQIARGSIMLCNESFASTNEREGSEIARQIIRALTHAGVTVLFVTHLYDLAHHLYTEKLPDALFLRAERLPDGSRTFRVIVGKPLPTSYGTDSYRRVFEGVGSELAALR